MDEDIQPTKLNHETLSPILRKVLNKSKAAHPLRFDTESNQIKLKTDKSHFGVLYLEAPYIALPNWDRLKLIERGKCCSYCGEVLKIYDNGKMKDDGNKSNRIKKSTIDKHERYFNGLDCSNCNGKWCDKQCKKLDFKHNLLYHRPSNKTASHNYINSAGNDIDVFYYDNWKKLEKVFIDQGLDNCYLTIISILHIYYDCELKAGFESLKCIDSSKESDFEKYLNNDMKSNTAVDYKMINEMMNNCFKHFEMKYLDFLRYMTIFKMNNYNGSIYLLFSSIKKSNCLEPNIKIEYFSGEIEREYEEFAIKTNENNSVTLVKSHVKDEAVVKPIYTNSSSGIFDKTVIQIMNTSKILSDSEIILPDIDYSNAVDMEDDEIGFLSNEESTDAPVIIVPVSARTNKNRRTSKIRNASFTSSGASFGEGIIKYNRDQIREMLENIADTLDEESSDESSDIAIDDTPSSSNSMMNNSHLVSMVKNLQLTPHAQQRRKSVKFEEVVTTI